MSLDGKVALITGATGGIGAAVARELASAGVKLVLTGREPEKLERARQASASVRTLAGKITDPALPQRLVDLAEAEFGALDILFNNAGVMAIGDIEDADIEALCAMVRVNVEAAFRMAYTALRYMKAKGRGHVVTTSSIAGLKVTDPRFAAYTGTKYALEGFTESLRLGLAGSGVRIGVIEPGGVQTGLYDQWNGDQRKFLEGAPMLAPEDIARAVCFMLEQPENVLVPKLFIVPSSQPI